MFFSKKKKKKNTQDFTDIVIHLYASFELLVLLLFLPFFQLPKIPGKKIPVPQATIIRGIIIIQIASSSVVYSFLPS